MSRSISSPAIALVAEVMEHETYSAQNLLYSVSTLKPGMFRRLTLRVAFWSVGLVGYFCRPGLLGTNHVIHFARWMLVPGTDKMLFHSNYDGTWLGYVGDFVQNTAGANGVTAIWSNCREFPRTHDFTIGANDRDRLVRWARRQQRPVHFWYQAYPESRGTACARTRRSARASRRPRPRPMRRTGSRASAARRGRRTRSRLRRFPRSRSAGWDASRIRPASPSRCPATRRSARIG